MGVRNRRQGILRQHHKITTRPGYAPKNSNDEALVRNSDQLFANNAKISQASGTTH